jgi:hypothetical protein
MFVIGSVAAADSGRIILLEGAEQPLAMTLTP